jgi:hypothetical protein
VYCFAIVLLKEYKVMEQAQGIAFSGLFLVMIFLAIIGIILLDLFNNPENYIIFTWVGERRQ